MQFGFGKAALGAVAASVVALMMCGVCADALADCGFVGGNVANGNKVYHGTCVACHGENGRGVVPGTPDFNKKGGVLSEPHSVLMQHIKNGFHQPGKPLAMPPRGGNPDLTDQDIKDVHSYLHHRYGCG